MRKTTKRRLGRGALYLIFIAAVLLLILLADWATLQENFFQIDVAREQLPEMITVAAKNTVLFTLIAFAGGLLLGILLALMKLSPIPPYRWVATGYIELFRGLPALLTIFGMAYALPIAFQVNIPGGAVGAGLLALIMVAGAYMAEVIRAGIQGVPKGQAEAARSLGMPAGRTMVSIILPQAFRIVIPPMTNEFVLLIKDTSLLFIAGSTLATREITTFARDSVVTSANATPLMMAAMLYLLITVPLTRVVAILERRMARSR
ncbi:amino acid ABC transporter membrane protein (PAAT family) [Haloactinopolyspora alba]|uniref:Amino acid ABC transporter membrane protein (PAAT family) n=1 Tax=Haloactinopolyspora alba TaxID=648780 RepID=A0A2P8EB18_9ACTN|nr:amino acid ABC transporter permease [Haloactinopolyspora alba]PSL06666.1 amino acid ABC transporter membrane protein (PAAT family) [Haloactinopolyspora alba]